MNLLNQNPKIVLAHPGQQHSYRVAKALKDAGMLYKYVTTVYDKENSLWMRVAKIFLKGDNLKRAGRRRCLALNDDDVIQFCEAESLFLLLLIRLDKSKYFAKRYMRHVSRKFQRKLATFCIKNDVDMVISYDTNSEILYDILQRKAPNIIRVMDNAHPNRHYLYHSYHEHWDCVGDFVRTLKACGYLTNPAIAERFGKEAKMANYHIVASNYSEDALRFDGIPSENIFRVPYGVDENKFRESNREYSSQRLNVLFMGDVNQRKGIRQLLEAARIINSPKIVFNVVGSGTDHCADLYDVYRPYVNILGYVSLEELLRQISTNHVFLFPTMGEGFGLVLLEAMAAGMPVITTANCGGGLLVEEGKNGFLVNVGDVDAIVERLQWCLNHPEDMEVMSKNAVATARKYTWSKYEKGIVDSVNIMFKKNL
jgi:glycosyltransferase involved in cell wall biosynthesis